MVDPLTAIGIVSNIVELFTFSAKVIARLNDFQTTLGEISKSFRHIKGELSLLQEILRNIKSNIDSSAVEASTKTALLPAIEDCKDLLETLDNLLAEILPSVGDSRFKRHRKALWSVTQERKVESITKTLSRYIAILTFYHVAASSTLQPLKDKTLVKIRRWLSPPNPAVNYHKAIKLRQPNTGFWLLESVSYKKWKQGVSPFIWLYGIPGCGKTIICSTAIQEILHSCADDPGIVVAYFYFDFTEPKKQNPELMLRSLISQLSEKCVKMPLALEALYSSSDKGNRNPSLDSLMDVLHAMLQDFPQSYLILDALDECADRAPLLGILEEMASWQLEEMRILVTSRKERDIESSLENIINKNYIVCLQSHVVDKDIQIYVRQRLSSDKGLLKWQKDAEIRQEIENTLIKGSCGMFRWAVCQMDMLGKCRTRSALHTALKALPTTLDETYERILCAINSEDSEYAIRILQWLAFSSRPLSLKELAEVVAIDVEREPAFNRDEVLEDPMDVLDICLSLVSVAMTEETVTLAHYSVKEYLVSARISQGHAKRYSMQSLACHGFIAKSCISYLLQFGKGFFNTPESYDSLRKVCVLAQYSAEYWIIHTYKSEENNNQLVNLAAKLLSRSDGPYLNWLRLYNPDKRHYRDHFQNELDYFPNPLYYASLGGLAITASRLFQEVINVNAQGGEYGNALQAASLGGYNNIVELLLSKGADVKAQGGEYGNALQAASKGGHMKTVELLLSKGADVNAQGGYHGNALQAASKVGHNTIVELLLSKGADVNAQGGQFGNALQAASMGGHKNTVELLLSKGADVNAQGGWHGSALQAASMGGHNNIVELLLSKGPGINVQGGWHGSALQAASGGGHNNIVELLLSKGADVNAQGGVYGNALQAASGGGHNNIVELLLSKGADVNAQGGYLRNALQAASGGGHNNIVELLLSKGANVKAQGGKYRNALQAASNGGHKKTVELLLSKGAINNVS